MKLYLDSADIPAVAPLLHTGLFEGVTTNPLILQRAGVAPAHLPTLVQELIDAGAGSVFVQAVESDTDEIVAEGRRIVALGSNVIVKVPATRQGFAATARLAHDGVPVLVTAVYHVRQAILANSAGAWGIAPYVGRMDDAGRDGLRQVEQMGAVLHGSETRVLAASIRNADVVHELALQHCDAVTMSTAVAEALFIDHLTDRAVAEFTEAARALT
ncbi:transaldolase family protein [Georgenia thermotolerans]|nr:transaldolase family protein [Georgenia thermotolerans]